MGAGPWTFYRNARRALGAAEIDLDDSVFAIALYTNSSNCADVTKVNVAELTGEVVTGNGYLAGGLTLVDVVWTVGGTADEMRFTADPAIWNAAGGPIAGVRWAVIRAQAAGILLCFAELERFAFDVASGNPLIIAFSNEGIFELG